MSNPGTLRRLLLPPERCHLFHGLHQDHPLLYHADQYRGHWHMDTYLTTPQALQFLHDRCGITTNRFTLIAWHKRGVVRAGVRVHLPGKMVGGHMRWAERDLLAWVGEQSDNKTNA